MTFLFEIIEDPKIMSCFLDFEIQFLIFKSHLMEKQYKPKL